MLFLSVAVARAVEVAVARDGGPGEMLAWTLAVLTAPRVLAIGAGLWLVGWLLWAALRVAWLAGALPILAARMADRPGPEFPPGLAWRFAPTAGSAVVALALDLGGQILLAATGLGLLALLPRAHGSSSPGAVAAVAAAAVVAATFLALSLSVLADATVARSAVAGEGPGTAALRALSRLLARPAAFVAAVLGVGVAGLLAVASFQSLGSLATGFVRGAPPILLVVPEAMIAAVAAMLAAGLELWRLSALAVLSLGAGPAFPAEISPGAAQAPAHR
jgi:hypothetical protein